MEEKNLTENENNGTADNKNFFADMFDWMCSIFSAILCFMIIFALFARVITVDGESMVPTLQDQQRLIVSDMFYTPQNDDIVIMNADKLVNESSGGYGKPIVNRVIGLPGDIIRIDFVKGVVYRNGEQLPDDYTNTPTNLPENFPNNQDVTVEDGKIFVLGDNRNGSKDSRSSDVGQVDMRYIMGKAYLRIWPLNALGML